jgi:hypothetical protein
MHEMLYEFYESLDDFRETISNRRENKVFQGVRFDQLSSQLISDKRTLFAGSKSYADAEELMSNGYLEPLEKIKAGVKKVAAMQAVPRKRAINNVVGFAPHVPNALAGIPQSMIDIKSTPEPTKIITLAYMKTFGANIGTSEIINAGINMLGLVQQLEQNGYRVALDVMDVVLKDKQAAAARINLKTHRQHIDYLKLTYPLTHPSMMRRHLFKWLETLPGLTEPDFKTGYGEPLYGRYARPTAQTDFLRLHKVLKENEYVIPGFSAIDSTPDKLIELCGIK